MDAIPGTEPPPFRPDEIDAGGGYDLTPYYATGPTHRIGDVPAPASSSSSSWIGILGDTLATALGGVARKVVTPQSNTDLAAAAAAQAAKARSSQTQMLVIVGVLSVAVVGAALLLGGRRTS